MGFLGVPLTELGTRLIFLCVLCQNCASLMHVREKHETIYLNKSIPKASVIHVL